MMMINATAAEKADPPLTGAEIAAINADVIAQMRARESAPVPSEARAPTPFAGREPEGGVGASSDDGIEPGSFAATFRDPYVRLITATGEALVEGLNDVAGAVSKLRRENQELRIALAEMKVALAEVTTKANQTDLTVQRLQIDRRGPAGPPGPQGRDGRDGSPGPRGEKGGRGQRGFEITGWKVDVAAYHATPVFYDNSEGPPLNLHPFFERYNADTENDDVDFETERAALSRARLSSRANAFASVCRRNSWCPASSQAQGQ